MAEQKGAALRKRQQIAKASRTMFFWVAGASVIVGASGVLLFVLVQKLIFNERVLAEKGNTISVLEQNNSIVNDLASNVRVLNTNQALIDLKTSSAAQPVQVVFDALPSRSNAEALGSALVHKDLLGNSRITVESISLDSAGDSNSDNSSSSTTMGFSFIVSAKKAEDLRDLLARMSRSIRAFKITSLTVEGQDTLKMTVVGNAYYEPAKTVDVTTKKVEP